MKLLPLAHFNPLQVSLGNKKYWQVCPTAAQPRDHSLFWSIYVNSSVLSSLLVTHRILLPKIYTKIQESFIWRANLFLKITHFCLVLMKFFLPPASTSHFPLSFLSSPSLITLSGMEAAWCDQENSRRSDFGTGLKFISCKNPASHN